MSPRAAPREIIENIDDWCILDDDRCIPPGHRRLARCCMHQPPRKNLPPGLDSPGGRWGPSGSIVTEASLADHS